MALVRGTFSNVEPSELSLKELSKLHGEALYLKQLEIDCMRAAFLQTLQQIGLI